jgi:hypothetical protein
MLGIYKVDVPVCNSVKRAHFSSGTKKMLDGETGGLPRYWNGFGAYLERTLIIRSSGYWTFQSGGTVSKIRRKSRV